jgi:Leucine-rich repeat (LRR) protein
MKPLRCIAFLAATSLFQDAFAQTTLPPLFLTNVSSSVSRNVSYVLRAWPGDYTVLSATNLAGAWTNEVDVSVGSSGAYAGVVPVLGRSNLFLRAMGRSPSDGLGCIAQFTTQGAAFEPDVRTTGEPAEFLWLWSDGTTSTNRPIASKSFGSTGKRMQGLKLSPTNAITSINLGFDGADGGWTTPLVPRASQGVSAVRIPYPLPSLRWWASSYNPIASTLDFSGYTSLEAIECFNCGALRHVVVTNLPALYRVCFEDCNLQALDLSGNPNLGDVRGALNAFTSIRTERGTGPNVWHWCTRDNPQLTQNFQDTMTNFYSLRELYIWNDNQHGHFTTSSTNLIDAQLYDNHFTSADFTGQSRMVNCILFVNDLTNLVLTGCSGLVNLDASYNDLPTTALDHVLTVLDNSAPGISTVNLAHNAEFASPAGLAHYTNLVNRGVVVMLDLPENPNVHHDGVWGGTNAITFITTNRITRMEIQCASTPTSVVWRWGDGTTNTGTLTAGHDFGGIGRFTNYVEVLPRTAVTRFGSQSGYTQQGIKGVYGASNFPNLNYLYLYQESLTDLSLAGCSNLTQLHLAENPVSTAVCDQWFLDLDAAVAGPVAGADFFYPGPARSAASNPAWTNLVNKGYAMHPIGADGGGGGGGGSTNQPGGGVFGGTNAITFITASQQPHMEIQALGGSAGTVIWHWGDGATTTNQLVASHDFGTTGTFTNYVEVTSPANVGYFGAQNGTISQGITGVFGLTNFPNLYYLFLYHESVTELSIAGCHHLTQLHLADNPVSTAVCDQWFLDLDAAVPGPVTNADFFYPSSQRTSASDAAWQSLVNKGYVMHPF